MQLKETCFFCVCIFMHSPLKAWLRKFIPVKYSDNSNDSIRIKVSPSLRLPGGRLGIGVTGVTIKATDVSGNWAVCAFNITVIDKQPPTVERCDSPPTFLSDKQPVNITWEEPEFSDNSGLKPKVLRSHDPGALLSYGSTVVQYTAVDSAGNNATCNIVIIVQEHACEAPGEPEHGSVECNPKDASTNSLQCSLSCEEGYSFALGTPSSDLLCEPSTGLWDSPFPDCSVVAVPNDVITQDVTLDGLALDCNSENNEIVTQLSQELQDHILAACGDQLSCHLEPLGPGSCEDVQGFVPGSTDTEDSQQEKDEESSNVLRTRRAVTTDKPKPEYKLTSTTGNFQFKFRLVGQSKVPGGKQGHLRSSMGSVRAQIVTARHTLSQRLKTSRLSVGDSKETASCAAGSVLRGNDTCVQCPRGTHLPPGMGECQVCAAGSFQPKPGQANCVACPVNTSTRAGVLPTKKHHCLGQCAPGARSKDGLAHCTSCPLGTYQPQRGQTFCLPCPVGTTTHRRAAFSPNLCRETCPAHSVSKTGLTPCITCPRDYVQPATGHKLCVHNTCSTNASTCEHAPLHATDPCIQAPCEGGSTCQTLPDKRGFECLCSAGFTGTFCELRTDPCLSDPCINGGQCSGVQEPNSSLDYQCTCPQGFSGTNCEIDEDECDAEPCLHLGACWDLPGNFSCDCVPGYQGQRCEELISACEAFEPCLNNAACVDIPPSSRNEIWTTTNIKHHTYTTNDTSIRTPIINSSATKIPDLNSISRTHRYMCECPPAFTGARCEDLVNPCNVENVCNGRGICLPDPWLDDGKLPSYQCVCGENYSGLHCEHQDGPCASSPCRNGATCTSLRASPGYRCSCTPQYGGEQCEIELVDDGVLRFPTSGTVDYVLLENALIQPLKQLTLCSWLRTADTENYGTPFSYATPQQDNTLALTDYSGFVVYVNGQRAVTDVSANDGDWHLVCLLWSSNQGAWSIYKDGKLSDNGQGLANQTAIPGGGTLVLGQEQDSPGGSFSESQSFLGQLGPTAMWSNLLTNEQLASMFHECGNQSDSLLSRPNSSLSSSTSVNANNSASPALLSWRETLAGIKGKLQLEPSEFCSGCGAPEAPLNGTVLVNGEGASAVAAFSCLAGFRLLGAAYSECSKRGEWRPAHPQPTQCTRISCGPPEPLLHGHVTGRSFMYGQWLNYTCSPGYTLSGGDDTAARECLHTGEWSGSAPVCLELTCTFPNNTLLHGSLHRLTSEEDGEPLTSIDSASIGEQLEVICDPGYIYNESTLLTCLDDGFWDHLLVGTCTPSCEAPPPEIPNSRPVLRSGNRARYSCLPGYKINGNPLVTCKSIWNNLPVCIISVNCLPPIRITHGAVETNNGIITIGSVAKYHCKNGFILEGSETVTCQSSGTWHPNPPICIPAVCDDPPVLENGNFTMDSMNVSHYSCEPGFELVGEADLTCENGEWIPSVPNCKLTGCKMPADIENGFIHVRGGNHAKGGIVEYKCNKGFQLVGPRIRKCFGPEQQWSSIAPYCKLLVA